MDAKQSKSIKVLMLPWLAHGHVSAFLELAKKLSTKNFHIYFCSTPIILTSIQNRITKAQSLSIELIPFHLPPTPELPPHHHTTTGLPPHLILPLIHAFQMQSPTYTNIFKTLSPDIVIYDLFRPQPPTIASPEYEIPAVELFVIGAAVASIPYHIVTKPDVEFPFPELLPNSNQRASAPEDCRDEANAKLRLGSQAISCKMALINSFREFEGKYIDYLPGLMKKKVIPTGPLVRDDDVNADKDSEILQWLDRKDEFSTVFVCFGSESYLSKEEREEVAHGLELSGVNFIWIVRFPAGETIQMDEALPTGFLERTREKGMVVDGWAPQARILAHPSTGGFVSHCGWNSIMESMKFGVPIVAVPMHYEQPINAKFVEAIRVGVEVKRDEKKRLDRENIAQVIRKVVVDEEGLDIRNKAREFREIIRKKGDEEIDEVAKELAQLCIGGGLT